MEDKPMFEQPTDLFEWIKKVWPIISNRTINKAKTSLSNCEAQMYWAGTIIRIDLKPLK